jgi:hypothetical protein
MKTRHRWLAIAFFGALCLALFGDKTPHGSAPAALASSATTASVIAPGSGRPAALRPQPERDAEPAELQARSHWFTAGDVRSAQDAFAPRQFGASVAVAQRAEPRPASPATPPPPPGPAPARFAVLGKQLDGERWAVYLSRGADLWVVRQGDVVDADHTVESIEPPTMALRHRGTGVVQQLDIGALR